MGDRGKQGIAQAFGFRADARALRLAGQHRAFQRECDLCREGFEKMALLGQQQTAPMRGLDGEDAEHLAAPSKRQILCGRAGQRVGAESRGRIVIEDPLGDRQIGVLQRSRPAGGSCG